MAKTAAETNAATVQRQQERQAVQAERQREGEGHVPDFQAIEASAGFRELMKKKKAFLIPTTALFLGLYLLFNIIISYTDLLDAQFIGDISWVWVFAFGLFAMTWILVTVYMKRAAKFDEMANDTLKEFHYGEEESR
ncbi:DUF485 domain-containing protein [Planococcus chinensis]|uniref:DUF485 domain-containing protein n=1 Tax=Planococcus chinensis TaxID=272917 RepID=A0ABW4QLD5_9BACL